MSPTDNNSFEGEPTHSSSFSAGLSLQHHVLPPDVLNPDEDSILDVLEKLKVSKKSSGNPYSPWQNLNDGRCVKYDSSGYNVGLEESRIMDFFRQHTTIPVPRIHMAFEREGTVYIVMDFVAGTTLIDSYISLSLEELQGIAEQLADFILQIRGLPIAPQTSLGSSNGGPFRNVYFRALPWDEVHNSVEPADAFQSVTDFNAYWLSRSKLDIPLDRTEHDRAVLTHGDLAGRNVLIDKGEIVGIVDWETFGCYPEFWETMVMWRDARWSKKWRTVLERTFGARTIIHDSYIRLLDTSFQEPLRY